LEVPLLIKDIQPLKATPVKDVTIEDGLWGERQATNRDRTIPAIYHQMKITGRLDAWRLDWQPGQPVPHIFWDSDAGKWIEAVGYSLATHPNPEFERQVDEVVDLIEKAQQPDGYLNIFYTAVEPHNRWTNLRDRHELYCAGHLMEGAVAYYQATGKRKLLDVLCRYTDHIDALFGPNEGKKRGYCGHAEIELALVRLYRETGEARYLQLSKYMVDERGQEPHYFDIEAQERGDDPSQFWAKDYRYCQSHVPVREQKTAVGHSVRAAYLYSGIADVAAETGDRELVEVCRSIWDDLTQHQMYVTGGLGPAHTNEGFTFPYDLPNETAYAETCAAIALVFWANRMFHIDPNSKYIDVMERALYNGFLSGVSFEGSHFFYANPLASYPKVNPYERWSGIATDEHYRRSEWFECACCPPNLARLISSVGSYFYSTTPDTLYVHLYNQNRANFQMGGAAVQVEQQTSYPWDGEIRLNIGIDQAAQLNLALRIPDWCRDYRLEVNGAPVSVTPENGYAVISRQWANNDTVVLSLAMPVERIAPHPEIRQDAGCIALQRGPVVYCLEEVDNGPRLANIAVPRENQLTAEWDVDLFGGVSVITGEAVRVEPADWPGGLYQLQSVVQSTPSPLTFKAIPYCFWANREPGEMRVWLREA
jgi:uncharacterized protein